MIKNALGNTGLEASSLVLGTWAIGGWGWGGNDEKDSIEAIHTALDQGINFLDTAPIYGQGLSEQIVGKAIRGRRDQVIIATKVGLRWDSEEGQFDFEADNGMRVFRNLKPDSVRTELERSLKNLGIETIDLLQTHWQDPTTPIEDTMETLLSMKQEGKIRAIGACNLEPGQMQTYLAHGPLDSIQEMYSMVDRNHESGLFAEAKEHGVSVLAYSPLAMGLLTGKITPERTFDSSDIRSWSPRFTVECRQQVMGLLNQFKPLAEKYDLTIAQLVIAWTLAQECVTHVLVGARNSAQALENGVAGNTQLDSTDLAAMTKTLEESKLTLPHPFLG